MQERLPRDAQEWSLLQKSIAAGRPLLQFILNMEVSRGHYELGTLPWVQ